MKEIFQPKIEKKIQQEKKEKIKNRPIAELREPINELLRQLKDKINNGEYNLLIGDDASGRIPTLILERIIRNVYREKGFKSPDTIFIAGSGKTDIKREDKTRKLTVLFNKYKKGEKIFKSERKENLSKVKALVITDIIISGNSLRPLCDALKQNKIDFEVATIGASGKMFSEPEKIEKELGSKIYLGATLDLPSIYDRPDLSGVEKKIEDVFATPLKKSPASFIFGDFLGDDKDLQKEIEEARKDVRILADELTEWYQKHYEKSK